LARRGDDLDKVSTKWGIVGNVDATEIAALLPICAAWMGSPKMRRSKVDPARFQRMAAVSPEFRSALRRAADNVRQSPLAKTEKRGFELKRNFQSDK